MTTINDGRKEKRKRSDHRLNHQSEEKGKYEKIKPKSITQIVRKGKGVKL